MKPLDLAAWCAALFLAANLFPHSVALRLGMLALGLALVVFTLVRAKAMHRPLDVEILPPLLVPILLWAAWAALSVTWSVEPDRSLKEFKNEIGYAFLAFWFCYVAAQAHNAIRVIPAVLAVGAAATCAIGLYVFWFPTSQLLSLGLHSGPGDQTSALLTLMPGAMVAAWLASQRKLPRGYPSASIALPVLFCASAYVTLNRTIWLGFATQAVILGGLLLRHPGSKAGNVIGGARRFAILAGVLVICGGVAMTLFVQKERTEQGWAPAFSKDLRLELWPEVAELIEKRPLTGYGFGRGGVRQTLHEELNVGALWHAHNLLLETAVELGLPGVTLLLLLLAATLYRGWRLARSTDDTVAISGAIIIAVVAGMLIRNMTDMLWVRQNSLLYWGVMGALFAWGGARSTKRV
jgi:O-antigen ligase